MIVFLLVLHPFLRRFNDSDIHKSDIVQFIRVFGLRTGSGHCNSHVGALVRVVSQWLRTPILESRARYVCDVERTVCHECLRIHQTFGKFVRSL